MLDADLRLIRQISGWFNRLVSNYDETVPSFWKWSAFISFLAVFVASFLVFQAIVRDILYSISLAVLMGFFVSLLVFPVLYSILNKGHERNMK